MTDVWPGLTITALGWTTALVSGSFILMLKGDGSLFPCAVGPTSLASDLVEIPLMGVQVCSKQQTRSPIFFLKPSLSESPRLMEM